MSAIEETARLATVASAAEETTQVAATEQTTLIATVGDVEQDGAPIFVDESGRRRRRVRGITYVAAAACAGYIAIVGISLASGQNTPLLALPSVEGHTAAGPPGILDGRALTSAGGIAATGALQERSTLVAKVVDATGLTALTALPALPVPPAVVAPVVAPVVPPVVVPTTVVPPPVVTTEPPPPPPPPVSTTEPPPPVTTTDDPPPPVTTTDDPPPPVTTTTEPNTEAEPVTTDPVTP